MPNAGQTDPRVRYSAQGAGFVFSFTRREALLSFVKRDRGHSLALRFHGASPDASLLARHRLPGEANYLLGADPAKHRSGLPTYGELVYGGLWPGIDMVFRGERGSLKYEFRLQRGARVSDIRLAYRGAERLSLARSGALLVHTPLGVLRDARPASYQTIGGTRVTVPTRYALQPGGKEYGFAVGSGYDPSRPLVIDPGLAYSTYLGGGGTDIGWGIALDANGNAYVTGETWSSDFPTKPGGFDVEFNGLADTFVTKLNASGSALVYSTFLGGANSDFGKGIAVKGGNAYVAGLTFSDDFPTTSAAFDKTHNGDEDTFVTKLSASGSGLAYSTLLGGANPDRGQAIALDGDGNAYVTGNTLSSDYPTTPGALDETFGVIDAFVTKLNSSGSALVYSTFLGGTRSDYGQAVAVGGDGSAYATGYTFGLFPTTPGSFDETFNGA